MMRRSFLFAAVCACSTVFCLNPVASRAPGPTPTFNKDIAPILTRHCVTCHRPGEVAPMPLLSYSDVRPWASAIKQRVSTRAMPPWHADPAHGTFRNDLRLSDREIDTIVRWVDGGAREGDPSALPPAPSFPSPRRPHPEPQDARRAWPGTPAHPPAGRCAGRPVPASRARRRTLRGSAFPAAVAGRR